MSDGFISVAEILKWKTERVLTKINTIYFADKGNAFLDSFLTFHLGEYKIELKAEDDLKNKITDTVDNVFLSLPQIEYIINQLSAINSARKITDTYNDFFGIESDSGIYKEIGSYNNKTSYKYYKILFEYKSHKSGSPALYNLNISITSKENCFPVDFDRFLQHIYLYKDILSKMHSEKGSISSIESIIRVSDREVIYKRGEREQNAPKEAQPTKQGAFSRSAGDVRFTSKPFNLGTIVSLQNKSINEIATEVAMLKEKKRLNDALIEKSLKYLESNVEDATLVPVLRQAIDYYSKNY